MWNGDESESCSVMSDSLQSHGPNRGRMLLLLLSCFSRLMLQSTLRDPLDSSPPGSPVPGILQARVLEWVAISFSNAWKWKVKVKSLSRVQLVATPWTVAYQAPPSMDFPGESTGVGCHCFLQEKTLLTWNSSLPSSPSLTKLPTKSLSLPLLTAKRFPFCHFRSIRNKRGADTNQDKRDGKSFLIIKS